MDWLHREYMASTKSKFSSKSIKGSKEFSKNCKYRFDYDQFYHLILKHLKSVLGQTQTIKKVKGQKDTEKALMWKKLGNNAFPTDDNPKSFKELIRALQCYTVSLAFAVPGSEEIPLSYANRSAVLLKMNRPEDSLRDIGRALELNYPEQLRAKLHYRIAECYEKLATRSSIEAKVWLKKVPLNDPDQTSWTKLLKDYPTTMPGNQKLIDEEFSVPKIKSCPNEKFPSASDAIEVRCSENFGRHVVATRDIEVGEVLVVEKPYSKILLAEKYYTHCSHCADVLWTGVACQHCTAAVYCSEECLKTAWEKYHRNECTVLDLLGQYYCMGTELLSLRIVLQAMMEAGGIDKLRKRIADLQIRTDKPVWPIKKEWYSNPCLEGIFTLVTNVDKFSHEELVEKALFAVRATFMLACHTTIFGTQYDWNKTKDALILEKISLDADVKFIGGLLIKLSLIMQQNFLGVTEDKPIPENIRAIGVTSLLSLLNHSCSHNTYLQCKKDHYVLYAILPIKKGEQIYENRGATFLVSSRQTRREELREMAHFECHCIACEEDWPVASKVESIQTRATSARMLEKMAISMINFNKEFETVQRKDVSRKKEMIKAVSKVITVIYNGVKMPCSNIWNMKQILEEIYLMTGNGSMERMLISQNN